MDSGACIAEINDNEQLNLRATYGMAEFSRRKDQVQLVLTVELLVQRVARIS